MCVCACTRVCVSVCLCVCASFSVYMYVGAGGGQYGVSDPVELELKAVVSCQPWFLGNGFRSSCKISKHSPAP